MEIWQRLVVLAVFLIAGYFALRRYAAAIRHWSDKVPGGDKDERT